MKLKEVKLQNFRGYKNETTISFENLNVFIGRNDAGKSSILNALNIFFNYADKKVSGWGLIGGGDEN